MRKVFLVFFISTLSVSARARVFNFDEQVFSTYLRGTFGTTMLQRDAYVGGYPTSISYSDTSPTAQSYSGEIGVAFTTSKYLTFRLGVELFYPASTAGSGTNSAGANVFNFQDQVYSVIPQGDFEFFVKKWPSSRLYLGLGIGYAVTTLKNTYSMASGNAFGLTDYIEEGTGWGIMGQGYFGWEFVAFDNVTLSLDLGYRMLTVNNFTANRNFGGPAGTFASGAAIKNVDGTNRSVNLSGYFSAVNFRFYFH